MRLKIYDAMWLIHFGANSVKYKDFCYAGYPLGGTKFLVKHIVDDLWRHDRVVVCFDSKTNKNSILAGYKSNRPHSAHIVSQAIFAHNMLLKCGVTAIKREGLEADDLIASVISKYRNEFKDITIVSNDKDTAHNVFKQIKVQAGTSGGIDIEAGNFSVAAAKTPVYYNTLSAYKVLTGDASDTILAFKSDCGKNGREIYKDYVMFVEKNVPNNDSKPFIASKKEIFEYFLKAQKYLSSRDRDELQARASVVFPTIVDIWESPSDYNDLSLIDLSRILSVLNDDIALEQIKMKKIKLSVAEFNDFKSAAQMLKSGAFAAENDCPVYTSLTLDDVNINMRLFQ